MKNLNENNKTFNRIVTELAEEIKRTIKFTKNKLLQTEIAQLCIEHLQRYVGKGDHNKQNLSLNMPPKETSSYQTQQIDFLKKQLSIQHELSRKMFIQLNKQKLTFSSNNTELSEEINENLLNNVPLTSSFSHVENVHIDAPLINSVKFVQSGSKNIAKEDSIKQSTALTVRQHLHMKVSGKPFEEKKKGKVERTRTLSKLRKLEHMFCAETPTARFTRKNSMNNGYWQNKIEQENKVLTEQNQSLKVIQNNLVTHLNLLEKYKHTPSIENLVHREEQLKKKQEEARSLDKYLDTKQRQLNKEQLCFIKKKESAEK